LALPLIRLKPKESSVGSMGNPVDEDEPGVGAKEKSKGKLGRW
jgi:hypothetical protein